VSFAKGERSSIAFLAVNPEGKVPVLLIEDRRPTEVAAILAYLAKRFAAANLLPAGDIEAEAQVSMSFLAATVHPLRPTQSRLRHGVLRAALVNGTSLCFLFACASY
jgi:glutathione S-transferase